MAPVQSKIPKDLYNEFRILTRSIVRWSILISYMGHIMDKTITKTLLAIRFLQVDTSISLKKQIIGFMLTDLKEIEKDFEEMSKNQYQKLELIRFFRHDKGYDFKAQGWKAEGLTVKCGKALESLKSILEILIEIMPDKADDFGVKWIQSFLVKDYPQITPPELQELWEQVENEIAEFYQKQAPDNVEKMGYRGREMDALDASILKQKRRVLTIVMAHKVVQKKMKREVDAKDNWSELQLRLKKLKISK